MKYSDIQNLKRSDTIDGVRVVYTFTSPSRGVGMGEQPEHTTVAFENGLVISGDEWRSMRTVHKPFGE